MITKRQVGDNIRAVRQEMRLTQKQFGELIGKSESQVGAWENAKSDIPLSGLIAICQNARVSMAMLMEGRQGIDDHDRYDAELRIYNVDDRLEVIKILAKNGYEVGQHKKDRTPTGKTKDYYVHAKLAEGNLEST